MFLHVEPGPHIDVIYMLYIYIYITNVYIYLYVVYIYVYNCMYNGYFTQIYRYNDDGMYV